MFADVMNSRITFREAMPLKAVLLSLILTFATYTSHAEAQSSNLSAPKSWNSSYGTPSPTERNVRLNFITEQEKVRNGAYLPPRTTVNNYTTNDRSVSNNITAGAGASVDVQNRNGDNSGTSSNVIGAINESTTNITTNGSGNLVDVTNGANSDGCIDGAITSNFTRPVGGGDISSGAGAASYSGSSVSIDRANCS